MLRFGKVVGVSLLHFLGLRSLVLAFVTPQEIAYAAEHVCFLVLLFVWHLVETLKMN